jgi:WD40 repeat protein
VKQETDIEWEADDDLTIEEMPGQSGPNSPWSPWRAKPSHTQPVSVGHKTRRAAKMAVVPAILCLALFQLVVGNGISSSSTGPSEQPLDLLAVEDDVGCLVDVAWSPDSQRVAILGYRNGYTCADERYVPAQLTIYSVARAAVLSRIQVDRALISAVHPWPEGVRAPAPTCNLQSVQGFPRIRYYDLLWSSNGLAMRFSALFPPCTGSLSQWPHAGVLTLDAAGRHAQLVQMGFSASPQLTSQWDSEWAVEISGKTAPPPQPSGYSSDARVSGAVLAVSPDGRQVASYSSGSDVDLFDSASGRRITSLHLRLGANSYMGSALVMRWSPDGTRLLFASADLGSVMVWELSSLQR